MGERWNWTVLAMKTGSEVSHNDAIRMSRQDVVGDRAETGVRRGIKMGDGGDETQMRMDTHRIRVVWGVWYRNDGDANGDGTECFLG